MRFRDIEAHPGKDVAEIAKLLRLRWGSVSRWLTTLRRDAQRALQVRKATGFLEANGRLSAPHVDRGTSSSIEDLPIEDVRKSLIQSASLSPG